MRARAPGSCLATHLRHYRAGSNREAMVGAEDHAGSVREGVFPAANLQAGRREVAHYSAGQARHPDKGPGVPDGPSRGGGPHLE